MLLDDEATWPQEVVGVLERNRELFDDWHGPVSEARVWVREPDDPLRDPRFSARQYDQAIGQLEELLHPHTLEGGYHCTRLTESEIETIRRQGLQLQSGTSLGTRIRTLQSEGVIDAEVAAALISSNQADAVNRAAKIWFCFFHPHLAGEAGIGDFLRYWGGEALYRSHVRHPLRGPLLQRIGVPCIVVADVPIALLNRHSALSIKLMRRYFMNRGEPIAEDVDHEGYSVAALPADSIRQIRRFPEHAFIALTKCDTWRAALT
jgi:hypothetical protein